MRTAAPWSRFWPTARVRSWSTSTRRARAARTDDRLREVWLISAEGTGLVSIGFLDGAEGRFDLPSGVDLAAYSLVDVSAEPDDGDATHSGDSIVRGELRSI